MERYYYFKTDGCKVSEKLDGIFAQWDGEQLLTKTGDVIDAPAWYLRGLTNLPPVTAELWMGRGQFEQVLSVFKRGGCDRRWEDVSFMIHPGQGWLLQHLPAIAEVIEEWDAVDVDDDLNRLTRDGAEGLVIRRDSETWKMKEAEDDDAEVIGHVPGKNRNTGRLGALELRLRNGLTMKLSNGLLDRHRDDPPAIGSIVEYSFEGRTARGIPKFATFEGCRAESSLSF